MLKLKRLRRPCNAMIVAPSAPGCSISSEAYQRATTRLQQIGISPCASPNLFTESSDLAVPAEKRLDDIKLALLEPKIDLIIAIYGGYNCIDLLPELPYELWKTVRKPLLGLSDVTALHLAIWTQIKLPSLHGPNFSSLGAPDFDDYTLVQLNRTLSESFCHVPVSSRVAEDLWYAPDAPLQRNWTTHSWVWHSPGRAKGVLIGGNLPTLISLAGTPYFPDFRDAIIFLEADPSDPVREIDRGLMQLSLIGVFDQVAGVIFGALGRRNDPLVKQLVEKHLSRVKGPIVSGVTSSHLDPVATLAIGVQHELDSNHGILSYKSPFSE